MKKRPKFLIFLVILAFLSGAEFTLSYNKERAKEASKSLWDKVLVAVKYIGEVKRNW